jgi:hypothetical protein
VLRAPALAARFQGPEAGVLPPPLQGATYGVLAARDQYRAPGAQVRPPPCPRLPSHHFRVRLQDYMQSSTWPTASLGRPAGVGAARWRVLRRRCKPGESWPGGMGMVWWRWRRRSRRRRGRTGRQGAASPGPPWSGRSRQLLLRSRRLPVSINPLTRLSEQLARLEPRSPAPSVPTRTLESSRASRGLGWCWPPGASRVRRRPQPVCQRQGRNAGRTRPHASIVLDRGADRRPLAQVSGMIAAVSRSEEHHASLHQESDL